MSASVIRVKIDLVLRLIDTTTGAAASEINVKFIEKGCEVKPLYKGDGTFIFINKGRENTLMQIRAYGYEDIDIAVNYEELDEKAPTCDVFLIPSEKVISGEPVLGISGNLPSLKSIDAVNLMRPVCSLNEFEPKKKLLSVFSFVAGKKITLDDVYYGLASTDEKSYEEFVVTDQSGDNKVVLKDLIQTEIKPNRKIFRLLYGNVKEDGNFIFRIRDDATVLKYLIRFRAGDETYFRVIDFREENGKIDLMEKAERLTDLEPKEVESE